jgi:TRAP-type C4-dicarboxylate transport system permease small subunit
MLYHGTRQVLLYQSQNTLVMEIPVGVLYTAIPMSGLLMGLDSLVMLVTGLRRYRRGEPLLPPEDPAGQADARGGA